MAIDTLTYLYKAKYSDNPPVYLVSMVNKLLSYGIYPYFVFEGKNAHPLKETGARKERRYRRTELERKISELQSRVNNPHDLSNEELIDLYTNIRKLEKQNIKICDMDDFNAKCILNVMGIPYIQVENIEAEGFVAYLANRGIVDYVLSEDSDVLAYGANNWLRDYNLKQSSLQLITSDSVKECLSLKSDHHLRTLCISLGTDFNEPIYKGMVTTYKKICIEHEIPYCDNIDELYKIFTITHTPYDDVVRDMFKDLNIQTEIIRIKQNMDIEKLHDILISIGCSFNVVNTTCKELERMCKKL